MKSNNNSKVPQEVIIAIILNLFFASFVFSQDFSIGGYISIISFLLVIIVAVLSILMYKLIDTARKVMLGLIIVSVIFTSGLSIYLFLINDMNNVIFGLIFLIYGLYEVYILGFSSEVLQAYKN